VCRRRLDVVHADELLALAVHRHARVPIFLPRTESERSLSGIASAISGSLTMTSLNELSVRTLSDLPIEIFTTADVRPRQARCHAPAPRRS